jgi:hypothetical protein
MMPPFPSPLPSPRRRGSIIAAFIKKPATGFAEVASENHEAFDCCSLSSGERVRVRGKESFI